MRLLPSVSQVVGSVHLTCYSARLNNWRGLKMQRRCHVKRDGIHYTPNMVNVFYHRFASLVAKSCDDVITALKPEETYLPTLSKGGAQS